MKKITVAVELTFEIPELASTDSLVLHVDDGTVLVQLEEGRTPTKVSVMDVSIISPFTDTETSKLVREPEYQIREDWFKEVTTSFRKI